MPQDMVWGDAPELAAGAWVLGVPHPTGYVLYLLSTHIFQWLPLGTVMFRSHLLSAILMATVCLLLYRFLCLILLRVNGISKYSVEYPALLTVLSFRLAPVVWDQANSTEVYALFLLLFCAILYFLFRSFETGNKALKPLFFIMGLSLIHHRLSIFLIAGTLWILLFHFHFSRREIMRSSIWLLPPILLILYYPLRAMHDPAMNWFNPDNLRGLYQLLSGGQFSQNLQRGIEYQMQNFSLIQIIYCYALPFLCYSLLGFLCLYGFLVSFQRIPWLGFFTLIMLLIYQIFMLLYLVGDWSTFILPSLVLLTIPLALGYASLMSHIHFEHHSKAVSGLLVLGFIFISLIPITISPDISYRGSDFIMDFRPQRFSSALSQRFAGFRDTSTVDYANGVWAIVPDGAPIVTGLLEYKADNEYNPLVYQQIVEQRQAETPILGAGFLLYDWYREQVNQKIDLQLNMRNDRPAQSREEWLEDTWFTVVEPALRMGPVYIPTSPQYLPRNWYPPRAVIQNIGRFPLNSNNVMKSYRPYLPSGDLVRLKKPE